MNYDVKLEGISDHTTMATFKYLDLDGDGFIAESEVTELVRMLMKALNTEIPGLDASYLTGFFIQIHDKDGDQKISEEEFAQSIDTANGLLGGGGGSEDDFDFGDHDEL